MNDWVSFDYREFYDIPRMLILTFKGRVLLLQSSFNEEKDDYSDKYAVYELPQLSRGELKGSWEGLVSQALSCLGEVPVGIVQFDPTRRRKINTNVFTDLCV